MLTSPADAWRDVLAIREAKPLVVNVTNYVVTNTTANALLALGASPAMSSAHDEMEDMAAICQAMVINMGTVTPSYIDAMPVAWSACNELGKPVVFDPVAVGATALRRRLAAELLEGRRAAVIRGNASEILALAGPEAAADTESKGADATHGVQEAAPAAKALAKRLGGAVCVSGETDYLTDGESEWLLEGGDAMMPYVTGLGCTASAICGAFCAVNADPLKAAVHAMAVMNAVGEIAADKAEGPGTLQLHLYDALYTLTETELAARMRLREAGQSS